MADAVRFIGRDRHGDYVFALPDGTYCSSPGDAGGVAAATEITAASYEEGRIVGRAPGAYLQQDGPIFGPDGILLEPGREIPLFGTYDLPAGADHIMDEPTDRVAEGMRQYEEPLRRKVAEREEAHSPAWNRLAEKANEILAAARRPAVRDAVRDEAEADQSTWTLARIAGSAVAGHLGAVFVAMNEIQPGVWRVGIEDPATREVVEIEIRRGRR